MWRSSHNHKSTTGFIEQGSGRQITTHSNMGSFPSVKSLTFIETDSEAFSLIHTCTGSKLINVFDYHGNTPPGLAVNMFISIPRDLGAALQCSQAGGTSWRSHLHAADMHQHTWGHVGHNNTTSSWSLGVLYISYLVTTSLKTPWLSVPEQVTTQLHSYQLVYPELWSPWMGQGTIEWTTSLLSV